jgi:hypothetical protein
MYIRDEAGVAPEWSMLWEERRERNKARERHKNRKKKKKKKNVVAHMRPRLDCVVRVLCLSFLALCSFIFPLTLPPLFLHSTFSFKFAL